VNSRITTDFVDLFRALPEQVRETARKNYRLWRDNHLHPSLQFKCVHATEPLYSARVGIGWRVLGLVDSASDTITWFWIGAHDEYDKLIARYR
jgi:hypothetical protein